MTALEGAGVYFGSPAEAENDLNVRTFRNSLEERLYRDGRKKVIDEQESMIRDGSQERMALTEQDADGGREEAEELLARAQGIRNRIKERDISAKDARDEIAKLNKEAERLAILAQTLPSDYAKALHDRDHPRDVLEFLYRTYPVGPMRFDF